MSVPDHPHDAPAADAAPKPPPRNATMLEVVPAVLSSFLGIRKGRSMQKDAVSIRPHQVIVVGLVLAAAFVVSLLLIVRVIIRAAGA